MGFRFRKSVKIAPGVRLNVGTKSTGLSFGGKGLRYSINTRGQRRTTASIPGTGISYSVGSSSKRYKTNAYNRNADLKKQYANAQKLEEIERNELEVEMFENHLEMIKSIHKECDDYVDWNEIKNSPPPFKQDEMGPNEKEAVKLYENFKPTLRDRLFNRSEVKKQELYKKIEEAKKMDAQEYAEWEELIKIASSILSGDIDSYFKVIEEFAPLDDLSEFGSGFEFFIDDPKYVEVEFDVHSEKVVPKEIKSLTKTGKLSIKQMPKTRYYDLQQDYICSCVIRIARDMFALLPINYILIHANDDRLDTATGHIKKQTLLSVVIDRETLNQLNLETIDCSDSMENFKHNMKFLKTKGLQPVDKISIESLLER